MPGHVVQSCADKERNNITRDGRATRQLIWIKSTNDHLTLFHWINYHARIESTLKFCESVLSEKLQYFVLMKMPEFNKMNVT